MKVVRLSAILTGRFCPEGLSLALICVRTSIDPKDIVRSEGFLMTQSGIEPATFRLLMQLAIFFRRPHASLYSTTVSRDGRQCSDCRCSKSLWVRVHTSQFNASASNLFKAKDHVIYCGVGSRASRGKITIRVMPIRLNNREIFLVRNLQMWPWTA